MYEAHQENATRDLETVGCTNHVSPASLTADPVIIRLIEES